MIFFFFTPDNVCQGIGGDGCLLFDHCWYMGKPLSEMLKYHQQDSRIVIEMAKATMCKCGRAVCTYRFNNKTEKMLMESKKGGYTVTLEIN